MSREPLRVPAALAPRPQRGAQREGVLEVLLLAEEALGPVGVVRPTRRRARARRRSRAPRRGRSGTPTGTTGRSRRVDVRRVDDVAVAGEVRRRRRGRGATSGRRAGRGRAAAALRPAARRRGSARSALRVELAERGLVLRRERRRLVEDVVARERVVRSGAARRGRASTCSACGSRTLSGPGVVAPERGPGRLDGRVDLARRAKQRGTSSGTSVAHAGAPSHPSAGSQAGRARPRRAARRGSRPTRPGGRRRSCTSPRRGTSRCSARPRRGRPRRRRRAAARSATTRAGGGRGSSPRRACSARSAGRNGRTVGSRRGLPEVGEDVDVDAAQQDLPPARVDDPPAAVVRGQARRAARAASRGTGRTDFGPAAAGAAASDERERRRRARRWGTSRAPPHLLGSVSPRSLGPS